MPPGKRIPKAKRTEIAMDDSFRILLFNLSPPFCPLYHTLADISSICQRKSFAFGAAFGIFFVAIKKDLKVQDSRTGIALTVVRPRDIMMVLTIVSCDETPLLR